MFVTKVFLPFVLLLILHLRAAYGHGQLMDPVNRSSAWRKGFKTPINYDDNGLNCGGGSNHDPLYGGKCGVCGDPYSQKQPRDNENGGLYGTGTIVKTYKSGEKIPIHFELSANHRGYATLAICPLKHPEDIETEECFAKYPLMLENGSYEFNVTPGSQFHTMAYLPKGLTCKHCVLRWHYRAGNNWGVCPNNKRGMGCGPQEIFRTCSDIAIL